MAIEGTENNESPVSDNLVDGFNWDNDSGDIFPAPVVETKEEKQRKVVKAATTPEVEVENENPDDEPIEEEHQFFEDEPEVENPEEKPAPKPKKGEEVVEDENPEGPENEDPENVDDKFFKTLAQEMVEKNIFTAVEIAEGDEINEDRFFELQSEEIQARVDETFVGIFEEINNDPDAVAFLNFKRQGGSTYEFFNTYRNSANLPENMDLEVEANQEQVLRYHYLNVEKIDAEDIEEKLEFVKEKGKTGHYAKKYYQEALDRDNTAKLALIKKQEDDTKAIKERNDKLKNDLQTVLTAGVGEGSFKFTAEEIKELPNYITKPSVNVGKNRFVTPLQVKLAEIMKDPKKIATLAKILRKDFDTPDLKASIETKVTKGVRSKLEEAKKNKTTRSTTSAGEKTLADFFTG